MKLLFTITIALCYVCQAYAQNTGTAVADRRIEMIFEKAEKTNRPVFVKVHLNGCPHCQSVDSVMRSEKVSSFFKDNFLVINVEANSDESKVLQKKYRITYPEFPLFLFFGADGVMHHVATPHKMATQAASENELIRHATAALDSEMRASGYRNRYQQGERDPAFLISYGKYARVIQDTLDLNNVIQAFEQSLILPEEKESALGLYVLRNYVQRFESSLAVYFFSNLEKYQHRFPADQVMEAGETIIYNSLFGVQSGNYKIGQVKEMRRQMIRLGVDPAVAVSRTVFKEIEAGLTNNNSAEALQSFSDYLNVKPDVSVADYSYVIRIFNQLSKDLLYLQYLDEWAKNAEIIIKTRPDEKVFLADLYYEQTEGYKTGGLISKARMISEKGLEAAKSQNVDITRFTEQIMLLSQ